MTERSNFLDKEDMMQELDRITQEEHRLSLYRENVLSLYMEFKYRFNKKGNFQIKLKNKWKKFNVKFFEFFDETHRGPRCK